MDLSTIIGIVSGLGCIIFAIAQGSGLATFMHLPSILIVIGGASAATLINFPLPEVMKMVGIAMKVVMSPSFDPASRIPDLIEYADKTRRQGLLSLESSVDEIEDEFLKLGLHLIIDGTDSNEVRDIMETEVEYLAMRHKRAQQLFLAMAKYLPGFGMIGTLIGLIAMLKTMSDPSTIGPSMAVALITTFYGALLANLIFMPIAGKLKTRTEDEKLMRRIILEGIIMIQAQANPRFINQKLLAYLAPKVRETIQTAEEQETETEDAEAAGEETAVTA